MGRQMRNMHLFVVTILIFLLHISTASATCECPEPTVEGSKKLLESGKVIADIKIGEVSKDSFRMEILNFYAPLPLEDIEIVGSFHLNKDYIGCIREQEVRDFSLSCQYDIYRGYSTCKIENICNRLHSKVKGETKKVDAKTHLTKQCQKKNGEFVGQVQGGFRGYIGCNLPSKDAGKKCDSKDDCEGLCLYQPNIAVNLLDRIENFLSPHKLLNRHGICQPYKIMRYGLHKTVKDGKVYGGLSF